MTNRIDTTTSAAPCCGQSSSVIAEQTAAATDVALGQAKRIANHVERFVASRPAAALGMAVAAGIVFGWWVKRK